MLNEAWVFVSCRRVCGRKRKGTPVKVCDRAYVTEDEEEESMSEHSYSPGIYRRTHILPPAVGVFFFFFHSHAYGKQVYDSCN